MGTTCCGTTDIYFNFITWHIEKEIETQNLGDDLIPIMDSMLNQMNIEKSANLLEYKAYMVKIWDICEIGQKEFGIATNKSNNVKICTHLQKHANTKQVTRKKEKKENQ